MATLTARNPTLLDLAKSLDPNGTIAVVAEVLNETNEILPDMSWQEGNLATGHTATIRSGLPAPTWRKISGFVQPDKATKVQVTSNTGMLEAYSEVDVDLAKLSGNIAAFRMSEDAAQIESMGQEMAETLFFGNETTEPEAFTGLAPYFNDLAAESGDNIIDAGGTGSDNASIWLVVWDSNKCFGIYPKGSQAGLKFEDLGIETIQGSDDGLNTTGRMRAYLSHYKWDAGLVVKDWRYVVRIANIDRSLLVADAASGADLPDLMFQALRRPPNLIGRPAFYMDRTTMTFLYRQLANATAMSTLTVAQVGGVQTDNFRQVPLRRVDKLAANEARVT